MATSAMVASAMVMAPSVAFATSGMMTTTTTMSPPSDPVSTNTNTETCLDCTQQVANALMIMELDSETFATKVLEYAIPSAFAAGTADKCQKFVGSKCVDPALDIIWPGPAGPKPIKCKTLGCVTSDTNGGTATDLGTITFNTDVNNGWGFDLRCGPGICSGAFCSTVTPAK